jgi:hypothetical protein
MGPPASGKSFYAALMAQECAANVPSLIKLHFPFSCCSRYEVQHILVGTLIKEVAAMQTDLGASVRTAVAASPRLSDALVADIIKSK